jgi:hypothetical protein
MGQAFSVSRLAFPRRRAKQYEGVQHFDWICFPVEKLNTLPLSNTRKKPRCIVRGAGKRSRMTSRIFVRIEVKPSKYPVALRMRSKMHAFWDDRVLYRLDPEGGQRENDKRMWWVGESKVESWSSVSTPAGTRTATARSPSYITPSRCKSPLDNCRDGVTLARTMFNALSLQVMCTRVLYKITM